MQRWKIGHGDRAIHKTILHMQALVLGPEGGGGVVAHDFAQLGYGLPPDVDIPLEAVVTAFQRHWRPSNVDGVLDDETAYRLGAVVSALP